MKIGDRYITYILEDFGSFYKLNILQGDSATGKTCLCEMGIKAERGMLGTSVVGDYKIHVLSGNLAEDCNREIKNRSNTLIIMDEDSPFLYYTYPIAFAPILNTSLVKSTKSFPMIFSIVFWLFI